MSTNKTLLAVSIGCFGLLFTTAVHAGLSNGTPVVISTSPSVTASGALGTTRNTADNVQAIGCQIDTTASGTTGLCSATNSAGLSVNCTTSATDFLETIRSLKGDSFLRFTAASSGGTCTSIRVINNSSYDPKN